MRRRTRGAERGKKKMAMTQSNDALMKAAAFDHMDMIHSPDGGHIVVVAVSHGVHVCWQCGEPFDEGDRRFRMIEKRNDMDAAVPCGVHAACFSGAKIQVSVGTELRKVAAGIREKVKLTRVLAYSERIAQAALEGAKKIVL